MDKLQAYQTLLDYSFGVELNANDFFHYATAQMVVVSNADVDWICEHIQKYDRVGLDAVMAYIQNHPPLPRYCTPHFDMAIQELMERNQEVVGDVDWQAHGYNQNGPYRKINIF